MAHEEPKGDARNVPSPPDQMTPCASPSPAQGAQPPEWAGALRQMYDAVVDEPLPEGIAELLARLDAQSGAEGA